MREKSKGLIIISNLNKAYSGKKRKNKVNVLNDISISFENGKFYSIMGQSGAGKTTLINILGLIDNEYKGNYFLNGLDVSKLKDNELAKIRMEEIGFIFQNFELDGDLNAYENVMMPMYINKSIKKNERYDRAIKLLKKVGLENRVNHFPKEMSGGEQQRVAIARALVNKPQIILADEPTGNLDKKNENEIFSYLKSLSEEGKCIIVVSHSDEVKKYADIIYEIENGSIRNGGNNEK